MLCMRRVAEDAHRAAFYAIRGRQSKVNDRTGPLLSLGDVFCTQKIFSNAQSRFLRCHTEQRLDVADTRQDTQDRANWLAVMTNKLRST